MTISIISNIASINAQRTLQATQQRLTQNMGRLSTGMRINRAADDAAGLAISERLRSEIRSIYQAERNGMDGISMLQVAEGGMNETAGILTRMRELAIQSATDTNSASDRGFLDNEFQALISEIDRIAVVTNFNGVPLLSGQSGLTNIDFQIGIQNSTDDRITVDPAELEITSDMLGLSTGGAPQIDILTKTGAQNTLSVIDDAIGTVSEARATIGSAQNRMQVAINNLGNMRENLNAAESRIRDTDVAEETAQMTRNNILMQSGVSVLAQANQQPSMALSLLGS